MTLHLQKWQVTISKYRLLSKLRIRIQLFEYTYMQIIKKLWDDYFLKYLPNGIWYGAH